jgi:hypothetical protein
MVWTPLDLCYTKLHVTPSRSFSGYSDSREPVSNLMENNRS